ncbi:MAG: nucleotidyltransferase family protein [Chlamydiia bacterium]|nr:nucleotidyltransferase family protein [Chlamydiia bacterium]
MSLNYSQVKKTLSPHKKELARLGARHLLLFGSAAQGKATKKSDVDILVDFDPQKGMFVFADLKFYLQDLLNSDVDLVSRRALHPALKKSILDGAKKIF